MQRELHIACHQIVRGFQSVLVLVMGCFLWLGLIPSIAQGGPRKAPSDIRSGGWQAPTIEDGKSAKRILQVTLHIQLKHGGTTRTRRSVFQMYSRPRQKTIKMKNSEVILHLVASMKPPREVSFKGSLQLKSFFTPIEVQAKQVDPNKPWTLVVESKLKNASATIKIRAEMLSSAKPGKAGGFNMSFKGVSLRRILTRLAEFNNLRLAMQPGVPKIKSIKLDLSATSRKALIDQICKRYHLHCRVLGEVLWVKHAAPAPKE